MNRKIILFPLFLFIINSCTSNLGHVHKFDQKIEKNEYFAGETKCSNSFYYSCSCGAKGEETFSVVKPGEVIHEHKSIYNLNVSSHNSEITDPALFLCNDCKSKFIDSICAQNDIPVIELTGDFSGISKDNKVKLKCKYHSSKDDFICDATLKYQGGYSLKYPKKNYSIQFFKEGTDYKTKLKKELFEGCGKQSKYCLKAEYWDLAHANNLIGAEIAKQVVIDRDKDDEINKLPNKGVTKGFPCLVYQNNVFFGLYNIVIPKDKWMYSMNNDSTLRQAIVNTSGSPVGTFEEQANYEYSNGLDYEFCSTEDDPNIDDKWVVDSFNNIYSCVSSLDGETFKNNIINYLDIDRTIDVILCTLAFIGWDNVKGNVIYVTYDGIKWIPNMYDMDKCFTHYKPNYDIKINSNKLYNKIINLYHENLINRYNHLKENIFTKTNVSVLITKFLNEIPTNAYNSDSIKWQYSPIDFCNYINTYSNLFQSRLDYLDKLIK